MNYIPVCLNLCKNRKLIEHLIFLFFSFSSSSLRQIKKKRKRKNEDRSNSRLKSRRTISHNNQNPDAISQNNQNPDAISHNNQNPENEKDFTQVQEFEAAASIKTTSTVSFLFLVIDE